MSLLIITSVLETNKMGPKSYSIIPCSCIQAIACFEHSNFFKVNVVNPTHTQQRAHAVFAKKSKPVSNTPCGGPTGPLRNPTTSFLTATTLIYAIGAGITAAAGTRLALQLILVKRCKLYSFQLQDSKEPCIVISCHYLPVSGFGQFTRLLPSLDVVAISQAPSPESNPNSPLPVNAMVGLYPTIES